MQLGGSERGLADGKGWELPPNGTTRREGGEEKGKRGERKELGKYDKVTSCSAAARLPHIWSTSLSWKILQEIREKREVEGGGGG